MLEKALKEFEKYVNNYDINDVNIKLKYNHSLKVMDLCKQIGESLLLSNEEIELCQVIGLLHDLGRFDQIYKYNTFDDSKSFDHAGYAVNILFDLGLIRKFISDNSYDELIKDCIYFHNKYNVGDYLDKKTIMFCEIIRDADKIDIYRVMKETPDSTIIEEEPTQEVVDSFISYQQINHNQIKNKVDKIILHMALIFDLKNKYSYVYIINNNYFNGYVESLKPNNESLKILFDKLKQIGNNYLKRGAGI